MTQLEAVKKIFASPGEHTLYEIKALFECVNGKTVSDAGISARVRDYNRELRFQGKEIVHRCLEGQSTRVYWVK